MGVAAEMKRYNDLVGEERLSRLLITACRSIIIIKKFVRGGYSNLLTRSLLHWNNPMLTEKFCM